MKDKLEQFIADNKEGFDTHDAPGHLWQAISKELQARKKRRVFSINMAAALILVFVVAAGWYFFASAPAAPKPQEITNAAALQPAIRETEHYYASLVQTQQRQLSYYCTDYHEICQDFKGEIDTLNIMYQQLKTQYTATNNNEAVLNAMIENLKEQVKLLTMQLEIIRSVKEKENSTPHTI